MNKTDKISCLPEAHIHVEEDIQKKTKEAHKICNVLDGDKCCGENNAGKGESHI